MGLQPVSMCQFTLSNMHISTTSRSITTKFYLKHHLGGRKAAFDSGPDPIRTQISMVTDSSHRVITGKNLVSTLAPSFFIESSSFLQLRRTIIKSWTKSNFGLVQPWTVELTALEDWKNFHRLI